MAFWGDKIEVNWRLNSVSWVVWNSKGQKENLYLYLSIIKHYDLFYIYMYKIYLPTNTIFRVDFFCNLFSVAVFSWKKLLHPITYLNVMNFYFVSFKCFKRELLNSLSTLMVPNPHHEFKPWYRFGSACHSPGKAPQWHLPTLPERHNTLRLASDDLLQHWVHYNTATQFINCTYFVILIYLKNFWAMVNLGFYGCLHVWRRWY